MGKWFQMEGSGAHRERLGTKFTVSSVLKNGRVLTIYSTYLQTEIRAGLTTWVGFEMTPLSIQKKIFTLIFTRPPWHTSFVFHVLA